MLEESLKIKVISFLESKTHESDWKINRSSIKSNESIVYRFSSENHPKDYALKVYYLKKSKKISHHYSVLERFSGLLNTNKSKFHVPVPVVLFIENNCFLMEWVAGTSLQYTLWKNCLQKNSMQRQIKQACHWLKRYHQNSGLKYKRVNISRYLTKLNAHRTRSDHEDYFKSNEIFNYGIQALSKLEKTLEGFETLHADNHGDLNLSNFIVSGKHITGIDIGGIKNLPVEDDLVQILNYVCINYFNMLTRMDMNKPQDTWEIFNVVLDAYGYSKEKKARDFFLYVFLYQMLYRWISMRNIHNPGKENTFTFFLLGKWRIHNSSVIVKKLTQLIADK